MKIFKINTLKEYSVFFWLFLIAVLGIFISTLYSNIKIEETNKIKSTFENTYLKKTIKELTRNLEPRYSTILYLSKPGDTHQSIINNLNIRKKSEEVIKPPFFRISN